MHWKHRVMKIFVLESKKYTETCLFENICFGLFSSTDTIGDELQPSNEQTLNRMNTYLYLIHFQLYSMSPSTSRGGKETLNKRDWIMPLFLVFVLKFPETN